jgi:DNA-binding NarL/FixJ family response regulator
MKYKIVIAEDCLLIAKAIGAIVESFADFEVLYEVANGKVLQERFKLPKNIPDILLLDISRPEKDGFATAEWLRENHPAVLIMALSIDDDDAPLIRMVRTGASGYLHKNIHPVELEKALLTMIAKGMYYPEWATNRIFSKMAEQGRSGHEPEAALTAREKEFLQYVCTELTYKEMAACMNCSPRTVESYRDSLFEKLKVKTRVALAMYAVKNGFYAV